MPISNLIISFMMFVLIMNPSSEALAYLDPGTGSMVLQLILGGIAGITVVSKMYWQKIKDVFRRKEEE